MTNDECRTDWLRHLARTGGISHSIRGAITGVLVASTRRPDAASNPLRYLPFVIRHWPREAVRRSGPRCERRSRGARRRESAEPAAHGRPARRRARDERTGT